MDTLFTEYDNEQSTQVDTAITSGSAPDDGTGDSRSLEERHEGDMVFKTKEEFQKQFDYEWNKRYKEQNKALEHTKETLDEVTQRLADFLGVEQNEAVQELKRRALKDSEQAQGDEKEMNPDDEAFLSDLQKQFHAFRADLSEFDLDSAMQNDEFQQAAKLFYSQSPEHALERAIRAVYFDDYQKAVAQKADAQVVKKLAALRNRVPEGALNPAYAVGVKSIDVDKLGSTGILELQKRILNGEKINL